MKNILLFIICGLFAVSCASSKRCSKKLPCTPVVQIKDSVIYYVGYETDTVRINIPADTAAIKALVNCDQQGKAQMKPQSVETSGQITTVSVTDGHLTVKTECKEKELQKVIETQNKVIQAFKSNTVIKNVPYTPRLHKFIFYGSLPFTLIGLLSVLLFALRQPWRK